MFLTILYKESFLETFGKNNMSIIKGLVFFYEGWAGLCFYSWAQNNRLLDGSKVA